MARKKSRLTIRASLRSCTVTYSWPVREGPEEEALDDQIEALVSTMLKGVIALHAARPTTPPLSSDETRV
jgi:hypothetical protein